MSDTANNHDEILAAYGHYKSIRATSGVLGLSYNAVSRVIHASGSLGGKAAPEIDYEKLAGMIAAKHGSAPVEGPTHAQPLPFPVKPNLPAGIHVAPKPYGRIGILTDLHVPYHDPAAVGAALSFLEDWKPDLIIVAGDLFDGYLISQYEKEPERLHHTLQAEFDAGEPIVKRLDAMGSDMVFILGNHCARIDALKAKLPGLSKLRALEWHTMASIPERWMILPQHSRYRIAGLDVHHGDIKKGPGGKHVACNMLGDLKRASVFGHFHRSQMYGEPDGDNVVRAAFSQGHLCDEAEAGKYMPINKWIKGFRSVDMDTSCGLFEVRAHLIHNGRTRINGKTYGG